MNTNDNNNIESIEMQAPPAIMHVASADDIEQLPIANDDYDNDVVNNLPNSSQHASKKYIVGAAFVAVVACTALFNVGMGAGSGITRRFFGDSNSSSSVSSASNVAFTASTNGGAKSAKAKATKSSATKSGKSVTTTTTTTSTTPVTTTTTTTSCPPLYVVNGTGLPAAIPDPNPDYYFNFFTGPTLVTLPVELEEGCGCTIDNVAIAIGIDHPFVGILTMALLPPDFNFTFPNDDDAVLLVYYQEYDANLVSSNKITFGDTPDANTKDPQTLGAGLGTDEDILAGTYYALGNITATIGADYPDLVNGLGKFKGETAAGDWTFGVFPPSPVNGTVESVELTITCASTSTTTAGTTTAVSVICI